MTLGFSGGQNLIAMAERYGVRRAQQIEQDGLKIEGALQKVTANRQIQGLAQTLAQIDPKTPDYTQKLMEIAPQFPEAMRDPRGQALFSMGVMANKQWEQRQAQTEQANRTLANQQTIQGLRQQGAMQQIAARNEGRANQEVDLSGLQVPQRLTPQNPATGIMTGGMSAPMEAAQDVNAPDETAQLMGMSGGLDSISERALRPLADAQKITGRKATGTQVFSAIAGERTREQQQKLLDDRQAQQDKTKVTADATAAEKATMKAAQDEKKAGTKLTNERQLKAAEVAVTTAMQDVKREVDELKRIRGVIDKLTADGKSKKITPDMLKQMKEQEALVEKVGVAEKQARDALQNFLSGQTLTKEEAAALLQEAGGDKEAARALARERGFSF